MTQLDGRNQCSPAVSLRLITEGGEEKQKTFRKLSSRLNKMNASGSQFFCRRGGAAFFLFGSSVFTWFSFGK